MKTDTYVLWIKEVNIELTKFNECLSCFVITNNNILERCFTEQYTPKDAAKKLHFLKSLKRDKCACKEKEIKHSAVSIEEIIENTKK